jgi:hypothetical protein
MPLVVIPQRITLDKPHGQFDGLLGMYYTRARLQALTEIAIERGIFPDEYLVARPGENPEIMQIADGKTGQLGVVKGGDIQQLQQNPGYKTDVALDRLERQERLEGSIPQSSVENQEQTFVQVAVATLFSLQQLTSVYKKHKNFLLHQLLKKTRLLLQWKKPIGVTAPKSFFMPGLREEWLTTPQTNYGKQTSTMLHIPQQVQRCQQSYRWFRSTPRYRTYVQRICS